MDRRERSGELLAGLVAMQDGWRSSIWTALPGIIESYDAAKKTCVVQPSIRAQLMSPDGSTRWETMPLLLDCPVQFPGGGGYTLSFPLAKGDEALVVFASRCIDAWWQSGGIQAQAELRMHDLSDGFCIPGISSVPKVPTSPGLSTTQVQLRSPDWLRRVAISDTFVEMAMGSNSIRCTATGVQIAGPLTINGEAYAAHRHSGVVTGGANTGGKVP